VSRRRIHRGGESNGTRGLSSPKEEKRRKQTHVSLSKKKHPEKGGEEEIHEAINMNGISPMRKRGRRYVLT